MKWLLIGASDIAETRMIPAMREIGDDVVGVMSANAARAAAFAAANDIPHHGTDLAEAFNWGSDGVYISSTNQWHAPQAVAAAVAGQHVLCEKPLAMTIDDARAIIDACTSSGVVLGTNHHLRNKGTVRLARDLVAEGRLGAVLAVRLNHAVYLPDRLQGWRLTDRDAGGGVILDITVHDADTLRFVTGREVTSVSAVSAAQGLGRSGVEDTAVVTMMLDNGAVAVAHESFVVPHPGTSLEIHGTDGSLFLPGALTQDSGGEVFLVQNGAQRSLPAPDATDVYVVGLRAFGRAVAGKGEPAATGADGLASLTVALAALESARTGRRIEMGPDAHVRPA